MKIRKFNEMFDTEELKSAHEIPMLQGSLFKGMKINDPSNESLKDLIGKVAYKFPFLNKFTLWESDKYKDVIFLYQKNNYWYISISFSLEGHNKYGVGILYKYLDSVENAQLDIH